LLNYGLRLGISHQEAEALFNEAERMASETGDVHSRALLLLAYGSARGVGEGNVREYARLARQGFALAEASGDPALCIAVAISSYGLYCAGDYREGVAICDRAIELAAGDPTVGAGLFVACPYAHCHALKGLLLASLGELDEARRQIEQGKKIARDHGDIEVVGWSHMFSVCLAYFAGEPDSALAHAEQALEIAERIGGSFSRAHAWFFLGLAEGMQGEWQHAKEAVERSVSISREGRAALEREPWRLALLGEAYVALGDPKRARRLVEEGLELARVGGSRSDGTAASLSLARILLGSPGVAARTEIEAALARTLELASDTGAKAFEPLIHVELAELARQSGEEERRERELREAHRLFTKIGATGHAERLARELAMPAS
jgi:tetratricopeptide (TPR) repeat protein